MMIIQWQNCKLVKFIAHVTHAGCIIAADVGYVFSCVCLFVCALTGKRLDS